MLKLLQLLNTYACAVEDALIEQVQRGQSMSLMLEAAGEERAAMNLMLTDPDVLADYVNDFFGPERSLSDRDRLKRSCASASIEARAQFEQEIEAQERNAVVPQSFQRPEMDMPTPGRQANVANDFWGGFSQMMDQNPEQAWQYLVPSSSRCPVSQDAGSGLLITNRVLNWTLQLQYKY